MSSPSTVSTLGRILLAAAAILSVCLGWHSISSALAHQQLPGCGAASGCENVLHSPWAWAGPVPVAWIGAIVYLSQVLVLSVQKWRATLRWPVYLLCSNFAAALLFTSLQAFVLGSWCPWCCTIHALACVGAWCGIRAVSRLWQREIPRPVKPPTVMRAVACGTMASLTLLCALSLFLPLARSQDKSKIQSATTKPAARAAEGNSQWLSLHDGKFRFDLTTLPILGVPTAKHVIVCITDPTCPHCRSTTEMLTEAWEVQPAGEVAIVFLPGTRDATESLSLQSVLLSLWRDHPATWRSIMEKIHGGTLVASLEAVRYAASQALGGKQNLESAVQSHRAWAEKLIEQTKELMAENARIAGGPIALPQTQYGEQLIVGALSDSDDLKELTGEKVTWAGLPAAFQLADDKDPCKKRKFCGSLTIIFNGAGENLGPDPMKRGVDVAARNTIHYLERAAKLNGKNNSVLLFSSDSTKAVADAIKTATEQLGRRLIHLPTSRPSFDASLKNIAFLEQMKASLASAPECFPLIKGKQGSDVSPFIKIEVLVASHSKNHGGRFMGLPVWPKDSDQGEDDAHSALGATNRRNPETFVDERDFDRLRNVFFGSLMHAVSMSCDAVAVAEMIAPSNSGRCSCYVGYTDKGVVSVVSLTESRTALVDSIANPTNGRSLLNFANPMQNRYRWFLMGDNPDGTGGTYDSAIFTIATEKQNHFDLFALTSADVFATEILGRISASASPPVPSDNSLKSITTDKNLEEVYREVEALVKKARTVNETYLQSLGRDPDSLKRSREAARDFYNSCLAQPEASNQSCLAFKALLNTIGSKRAEDEDFAKVAETFASVKADLAETAGSPVLEGDNDDPVANLAKFRGYWDNFATFRIALVRAATKLGKQDDVKAPLKAMSTKWATYHSAYINAYFPDIAGDTLKRRTDNYLKAAEVLKARYLATGMLQYKEELYRLRSQLKCVLNFPIGPNYKEVVEFPASK